MDALFYTSEYFREELEGIERHSSDEGYLNALAAAALRPHLTQVIFVSHEDIFPEICARWLSSSAGSTASGVLLAFTRILPFATYLVSMVDQQLTCRRVVEAQKDAALSFLSSLDVESSSIPDSQLQNVLLAFFRLFHLDQALFARAISPSRLQFLFNHESRVIRYLSIRLFGLYVRAATALVQDWISQYLGEGEVAGQWEGYLINYQFLDLWEHRLFSGIRDDIEKSHSTGISESNRSVSRTVGRQVLSPWTGEICGILLPRISDLCPTASNIIFTPTATKNAKSLAQALKSLAPILVTGPPGSGKSMHVMDAARELGADKSMLTLHLNDQTDAKLLIGMYTTGSKAGSFHWRPGLLTTAVRDGRWVFIEDLDRAPSDVMEVLSPLLSRRELRVPSQGETIRAAPGFRILASMRSRIGAPGHSQLPSSVTTSERLWNIVDLSIPNIDEVHQIVLSRFPTLHACATLIINVYERVQSLYHDATFVAKHGVDILRQISLRDIIRWCRRIQNTLSLARTITGAGPVREDFSLNMFAEATYCFAGFQSSYHAREAVTKAIGEELHIPPQQVTFFAQAYAPRYRDTNKTLAIGRVSLPKRRAAGAVKGHLQSSQGRTFVATNQTLRLLEQVGAAVQQSEPVLLVGETGCGKTALVQHLAECLGRKLTVLNMSHQSESGDLLGGLKPVSWRSLIVPLTEDFESLFESTFSTSKNLRYTEVLKKCIAKERWARVLVLWREALKLAETYLESAHENNSTSNSEPTPPSKKRKMDTTTRDSLRVKWAKFNDDIRVLEAQISDGPTPFAFKFVEGSVIRAARNGEWILLDEINLAPPDTLESLAGLLSDDLSRPRSILLPDAGEAQQIHAHEDFRIFGAMNPATDVGKRDLASGLRSRFSEIYVEPPDRDINDLILLLKAWLGQLADRDRQVVSDVAKFYTKIKQLSAENKLADNANGRPHYSLRTLTRTLNYISEFAPMYGIRRAMYEAFSMTFLTNLDRESERLLLPLIDKFIVGEQRNMKALLKQTPRLSPDDGSFIRFENYLLKKGNFPITPQPHYIITPFVRHNLSNLIRALSARRLPVLLQGPTSSGKTSMITFLANITGNKLVRINNHEHTDIQEYIGAYNSDSEGKLRFQYGVLVRALQEGHWILLDELNLAPTDVLEALNRLLDENRELMIPETQEVVRPHPNFLLLATQNPPGVYGGRKYLSRAFRNRFIELYFGEIPEDELETILQQRTQIAPSFCARIVSVYKELLVLRQSDRLFEHKNSFVTLRDLFRWASRDADNREQLAIDGYVLIAERIRNLEEKIEVKKIIERVFKVTIDEEKIYDNFMPPENGSAAPDLILTRAMRRLHFLITQALKHHEPVLLVGETGCGKTSLCQSIAAACGKEIHIVNAQQNTETGDIIGAQRPVRGRAAIEARLREDLCSVFRQYLNHEQSDDHDLEALQEAYSKLTERQLREVPAALRERISHSLARSKTLFEWSDGALVQAMKQGDFFLLDEISLADDSVLERLNSVLEPQRTLLLAEKGAMDSLVEASPDFKFLATMNPGGDFGKRELTPALRNRFTEIWVPPLSEEDDIFQIVNAKLSPSFRAFSRPIVSFARWFSESYSNPSTASISIRDALSWVEFINCSNFLNPDDAYLQGASLVFIDTLGANPAALRSILPADIYYERRKCLNYLSKLIGHDLMSSYFEHPTLSITPNALMVGPFMLQRLESANVSNSFQFGAPTTRTNAMRLLRALQLKKPILLEGSPGVGKTTLISALAHASGRRLTRINLSEQTDLMDLFGTDVPVSGAELGAFAWRDGPFLKAMQEGEWVLLDEMNLASQSVLEGLNSCFDHRGEVYISELNQTFRRHPDFIVFATQNPYSQGAGRKGLPLSFVNRFSVAYADEYTHEDMLFICSQMFPEYPMTDLQMLLKVIQALDDRVVRRRAFGSQGGPWDFNLRDLWRWLQLLTSPEPLLPAGHAAEFLSSVVTHRFRTEKDKQTTNDLFAECFGHPPEDRYIHHRVGKTFIQVGLSILTRSTEAQNVRIFTTNNIWSRLPILETIALCVQKKWPCVITGPSGSGKGYLVKFLANFTGAKVVEIELNSNIDTADLLGGYEQMDSSHHARLLVESLETYIRREIRLAVVADIPTEALTLLERLQAPLSSREDLVLIREKLVALNAKKSSQDLAEYIAQCNQLIELPTDADKARFEWVYGTLVKAIREGAWVILRNANLCTSSVLDRLNSLLEPNGSLIVNEHHTEHGKAVAIHPHPNFRIFLTLDPRYGELSRAMRNRSVEVYVSSALDRPEKCSLWHSPAATVDFGSSCFATLTKLVRDYGRSSMFSDIMEAGLWRLSLIDLRSVELWARELEKGLVILSSSELVTFSEIVHMFVDMQQLYGGMDQESQLPLSLGPSEEQFPVGFGVAQTIDPIQNNGLILYAKQETKNRYMSMAFIKDVLLDMLRMKRSLTSLHEGPRLGFKGENMSNLDSKFSFQRQTGHSHLRMAIQSFLGHISQDMLGWALSVRDRSELDARTMRSVKEVISYWFATFQLALRPVHATQFQAYIHLWKTLISSSGASDNSDETLFDDISRRLNELSLPWQLETGLSMERLWCAFRPLTPTTWQNFDTMLRLENLAVRFDSVSRKIRQPINDIVALSQSISTTARNLLMKMDDWNTPLKELEEAINGLEARTDAFDAWEKAYFQSEFEILCQYHDLVCFTPLVSSAKLSEDLGPYAYFFANRPTISTPWCKHSGQAESESVAQLCCPTALLSNLLRYTGFGINDNGESLRVLRGTIALSTLSKLCMVKNLHLSKLDLVRTEIKSLGRSIGRSMNIITISQLESLSAHLARLLQTVFAAHDDLCTRDQLSWIDQLVSTINSKAQEPQYPGVSFSGERFMQHQGPHFHRIAETFLIPCVNILLRHSSGNEDINQLAKAWVMFGVGCLLLYVPNRQFDPFVRAQTEAEIRSLRKDSITRRLDAFRLVENSLTGQKSNPRCDMLEKELQSFKEGLMVPRVVRPEISDMDQLQNEFSNILSSITEPFQNRQFIDEFISGKDFFREKLVTLRLNAREVAKRLHVGYRAYDDLTAPVVGFLGCLDLGLSLMAASESSPDQSAVEVDCICSQTPLLSAKARDLLADFLRQEDADTPASRIRYLRWLAIVCKVQGLQSLDYSERKKFVGVVRSFYNEWKKRLSLEQKRTAVKASLYRYQGNAEDEELVGQTELEDLFPTEPGPDRNGEDVYEAKTPQAITQQLATLHSAIFRNDADAPLLILQLLEYAANSMGSQTFPQKILPGALRSVENLLPSVMVSLDRTASSVTAGAHDVARYDFYRDPNIKELERLLDLVRRIRFQFSELRNVWPEHTTLQDVVTTCEEVAQFACEDPLSKVLTKVEKLHSQLHEWQLVASKEVACNQHYDELVSVIVSWRRLELLTWARLFDFEKRKCEEETNQWFFMAYGIVVAMPLSLLEAGEGLGGVAANLASVLEDFSTTTTLGQFTTRLQMLRELNEHVLLVARDSEGMLAIHKSLASMINFQNSFKPQVDQALAEGTQALEKDIKEIILLASWKDTNINALRESARRSHVKLLNVVRKYRALLSRPVADYVRAGLPAISLSDITLAPQLLLPEPPRIDQAVVKAFRAMLPNWSERPQRLVNIGSTVQKMNALGQTLVSSTNLSQPLEAFISELTASMKELQEETPSTASDENKDVVAHLKTRKRKLFAETLRGVRRMGFQYNLSTDILSAQSSLAAVLTRTHPFPAANDVDNTDNTDLVFHRLLDLMPRVRHAARDHSSDLTRDEVNRSVGHLEGILYFLLRQREAVVESLARAIAFKDAIQACSGLCVTEVGGLEGISVQPDPHAQGFGRCITWLPHILDATHQILKIHNRLADIDGASLEDSLVSWKQRFSDLSRREQLLPLVPEAIVTSDHIRFRKDAEDSLTELRASLNKWSIEQPLYRYIIKQILLWTEPLSMSTNNSTEKSSDTQRNNLSVQAVEEALSTICDKSLIALQEMKQEAGVQVSPGHERNWLIRHDEKVAALIRVSHSSQLVSDIQAWAKTLRSLAKQELRVAAILFNMARPILQQYADVLVCVARSYSVFHRSNCTLGYVLARAFSTLAQKGYCAPDEKSKAQDGAAEQVENGTGLGEGEAAEDISKDVDAESLPDIAQEPNQSTERQEMEHEMDAVEMADGIDGQVDDASQEEEREASDASDASDAESEMDERVDGVDDLDPTAVDEKFWDGKDDAGDKNQTSDKARGKGKKDEQVAAADTEQPGDDGAEGDDESEGDFPEEDERVSNEEPQKQDEYTQEGTTLDLPEEMSLDGGKQSADQEDSDQDDDLAVNEADELDHKEDEEGHNPVSSDSDDQPASVAGSLDHADESIPEEKSTPRETSPHANERDDEVAEEIQEMSIYDAENDEAGDDNSGPSGARGAAGSRQAQDESMQQQHEPEANGEVEDSTGAESGPGMAQEHEGTLSPNRRLPESSSDAKPAEAQQAINEPQAQAFRKLGDVLKNWQRQYRRIQEASSEQPENDDPESRPVEKPAAVEHLQNEEDLADAQALGAATEEQAHALDQQGVSGLTEQEVDGFLDDDKEGDAQSHHSPDAMDVDEPNGAAEPAKAEGSPKHPRGLIGEYKSAPEDGFIEAKEETSEDIDSKNTEASALEPDNSSLALPFLRDASDAQALWARYENDTRALSLQLTEQLRLILSPTVARKMRGDFRTGKRLNIRRIIPYIASQFRRDKIWLRRAQPSARRYQILLAVDDSKSMADGAGAAEQGQLALATLAMVARSLALLEAGQLCVVAFGAEVRVAHDFGTPWDAAGAAGAAVFRHFGFRQTRTDVRALLERSLALFHAARLSATSSSGGGGNGSEPWQLQLIISDGVCEDHAAIRRLVRQAREERIMIVFIIVDDVGGGGGSGGDKSGGKRSILEMRQATFEAPAGDNGSSGGIGGGSGGSGGGGGGGGNGMLKVRMQRYLDTFPFPFYVVVGDVHALPGVLATALRQWFREVVDAGA